MNLKRVEVDSGTDVPDADRSVKVRCEDDVGVLFPRGDPVYVATVGTSKSVQ